ncbi:protein synthesis inhibitor II-like [Oryza brachyantha]|uniref:protein synthesis inhibitor II-like n=1 Tax=Oryza brachyantha TaxID=4533 RepID=UPI001ADB125E|nr:protein synthesis inhibitor II-like [Oryza brachyantha]
MALNPLFTVTFNVSSSDNYGDFIAGIRNRLGNPRHFSHNRPVLPPVEPNVPPRRWFHVVLRTQTAALTLATRADNLYLEGFRSSDGTWWELTRGLLGAGATYAGFGGSYPELVRDTDKLVEVELGRQPMTQAVDALAARTPADLANGTAQQVARKSVTAVLLMVNEAVRFLTVAEHVAGFMHPKTANRSDSESWRITGDMKEQVNGWQDLSEALLKMDALLPKPKPKPSKNKEKTTAAEEEAKQEEAARKLAKKAETAAKVLGILLFVEVPGGMTTAKALQLFRGS